MNFDDIRKQLYIWLNYTFNQVADGGQHAIPIYMAHSDYIKPDAKTYVELKFVNTLIKIGTDDFQWSEADNSFKLKGQREFLITVNIYGDDALQCAADLQCAEDSPMAYEILKAKGLAIRELNIFDDVTQYLESDHQIRMTIDIRFSVGLEKLDATPTIDKVKLRNKFKDPAFEFVVDLTQTGG